MESGGGRQQSRSESQINGLPGMHVFVHRRTLMQSLRILFDEADDFLAVPKGEK